MLRSMVKNNDCYSGKHILRYITIGKQYDIINGAFVDDNGGDRMARCYDWIDESDALPMIPKHGDRYETDGDIYEYQIPQEGKWVKL